MTALATIPSADDEAALPIVSRIRRGLGVVPILGAGSVLLQPGDVAVYDEDWIHRNELVPGLYAIEYQRPTGCMPYASVARRFADNDPVRFDITRTVVRIERFKNRRPELNPHLNDEDYWMIHPLAREGRMGARRVFVASDGPIWTYHLTDKLLGPIVGIYAPTLGQPTTEIERTRA